MPILADNIEESSLNLMITKRKSTSITSSRKKQTTTTTSTSESYSHLYHRKRDSKIKAKHKISTNNSKVVNLQIYQLIEPYGRIWLTTKAVSIADMEMDDKKWVQIKFNEAIRSWLDGSRKNLGLEIFCENCFDNNIFIIHDSSPFFTNYDDTPVLNVVGKLVQREKRSKLRKYRPLTPNELTPPPSTKCSGGNSKKCCRHSLLVNLHDLEGFEFIIQPKIFDAGFCRGRCPYKYNPATHHAMLQSILFHSG